MPDEMTLKQRVETKRSTTARGFRIDQFRDAYGVSCSLQESSRAGDEGYIWFGCDAADPKVPAPGAGWQDVPLPEGTVCTTRMHLSQSQVADLLPALLHFALHGKLPAEMETPDA